METATVSLMELRHFLIACHSLEMPSEQGKAIMSELRHLLIPNHSSGDAIRTRKSYSVNCIHIRITSFLDRMLLPFIGTPTPTTPVFFSGGANNQNDLFSNFTRTSEWNLFEVRSGIKLHPTESRSSFNARHETDLHENCSQKFYSCDSLDWCISCSFYEQCVHNLCVTSALEHLDVSGPIVKGGQSLPVNTWKWQEAYCKGGKCLDPFSVDLFPLFYPLLLSLHLN